VAENKYMGSRGHILAFRHPSVCPGDLPLISVISRSGTAQLVLVRAREEAVARTERGVGAAACLVDAGTPFFDDASTIPWEWHSELSAAMEREGFDFVILDGEVPAHTRLTAEIDWIRLIACVLVRRCCRGC
jgi:hypothetical protein